MVAFLRFGVLAAALATAVAQGNPFVLQVQNDGTFSVTVQGWDEFALAPSEVGLQLNGSWVSSAAGQLLVDGPLNAITGTDSLGDYSGFAAVWKLSSTNSDVLITTWRTYTDLPAIVFDQYFPVDIQTGGSYEDRDSVSSAFPTFAVPKTSSDIGVMHYEGAFINNGVNGPTFASWGPNMGLQNGLTGGPLVFFEPSGNHSVVFSSFSNFMAGSAAQDDAGNFRAGFIASLKTIPAGSKYSTILWYGNGVNNAMMFWGAALLEQHGKHHEGPSYDYTNNYLGYNTDHGAYYYYTTGTYTNYLEVLLAVYADAAGKGIPYKHVLLDSWWYFKGTGNGVMNWTAMPSVFPGGNDGIRNLTYTTGWKVIAHNRYWSSNTNYATQNGGSWQFAVDTPGSPAGGEMAVPLEQGFWEYLLTDSAKWWGLTTYEQDWLYNELEGVDVLTSNISLGRQWLLQMDAGAASAGVTIQMCMPYPRHILQSVEMPQVTQTRASDDHVPGEFSDDVHKQWRMGYSSMFAWSVAVAPFKDNFYSSIGQPGGSVGNAVEMSPALQEAISLYSMGPVTPGDGVGFASASLLLRSCTTGGRLLKPSRAATAINNQVIGRVFSGMGVAGGEVYATYSFVSGWAWDHVLGAAINSTYRVTTSDISGIRGDIPIRFGSSGGAARLRLSTSGRSLGNHASDLGTIAYALNSTTFNLSTLVVQPFDSNHTIALKPCDEVDFQLWHTAPVFANGWALLGELNKFVPVSSARVASVGTMGPDTFVDLVGEAGETVPLTFWNNGTISTIICVLDQSGTASAAMPAGSC